MLQLLAVVAHGEVDVVFVDAELQVGFALAFHHLGAHHELRFHPDEVGQRNLLNYGSRSADHGQVYRVDGCTRPTAVGGHHTHDVGTVHPFGQQHHLAVRQQEGVGGAVDGYGAPGVRVGVALQHGSAFLLLIVYRCVQHEGRVFLHHAVGQRQLGQDDEAVAPGQCPRGDAEVHVQLRLSVTVCSQHHR